MAELAEAFDVRAVLESHGARLALAHITEAHLAELSDYLQQMRIAAKAGDPSPRGSPAS
jgi:DNA-binding GntR family transcriptional regulator